MQYAKKAGYHMWESQETRKRGFLGVLYKNNDIVLTETEYLSILYLNGGVLYGNNKFKYQNR